MRLYCVPQNCPQTRCMDFLCAQGPLTKHSVWLNGFKRKDIRVNGAVAAADTPIHPGDSIRVAIADEKINSLPQIPVLYQDRHFVVVQKPSGLPVLQQDAGPNGALSVQAVVNHNAPQPLIPCHRLDVFTGGTLLLARSQAAYQDACSWFTPQHMLREYRTVVVGKAPDTLNACHYGQKNKNTATMRVFDQPAPGRLEMRLTAQCLACRDGLSALAVQLQTGRTHQIRAQLAHLGLPVLGDDKYGQWDQNARWHLRRPVLWHNRIGFFDLPAAYQALDGQIITSPPNFAPAIQNLFGDVL